MAITDLPGVPDTAPITRPAKVHYPACYLGPAYYLGRPAAQYLAVYSRGKAHRSGLPELARAHTNARLLTSVAPD
jgi:hypothetical protein